MTEEHEESDVADVDGGQGKMGAPVWKQGGLGVARVKEFLIFLRIVKIL